MKTLSILVITLSLIFCTSCNKQQRQESDQVSTSENVNSMRNSEVLEDSRSDADEALHKRVSAADFESYLEMDRTSLYALIGMSNTEIERFEKEYKHRLDTLKANGLENYTIKNLHEQEDESMHAVLSNYQYIKYLELKMGNTEQAAKR